MINMHEIKKAPNSKKRGNTKSNNKKVETSSRSKSEKQ